MLGVLNRKTRKTRLSTFLYKSPNLPIVKHVVFYSGGVGSWAAASRVVAKHGTADTILLCADTKSEHEDWYRFVEQSSAVLNLTPVIITRGYDIWELAQKKRAIPNTRMAFCSRILKRELMDEWLTANADPETTTLHFGFDWMEQHRLDAVTGRLHEWRVDAPLLWEPLISKPDILEMLQQAGVDIPAAYQAGMPHNNCLKYGCVKGGIAYWRQVLDTFPDAYARSEKAENKMRQTLGKNIAILRDRRGGTTTPLTLTTLRKQSESQPSLFADSDEWAACACF